MYDRNGPVRRPPLGEIIDSFDADMLAAEQLRIRPRVVVSSAAPTEPGPVDTGGKIPCLDALGRDNLEASEARLAELRRERRILGIAILVAFGVLAFVAVWAAWRVALDWVK